MQVCTRLTILCTLLLVAAFHCGAMAAEPAVDTAEQVPAKPTAPPDGQLAPATDTDPSGTVPTLWRDYQRKRFNGASQMMGGSEIEDIPTSILSNALAGHLAGVVTIQNSGEPGFDGADVYIRRVNPLVYIDGRRGSFRDVALDDIESITVLKDAAAAAIYGIRGAGGAIMVTTKRGTLSAPVISFKAQLAYNELTGMPEPVDAATYATYFNQAYKNSGLGTTDYYPMDAIAAYRDGSNPLAYPNVGWRDELLKDGYFAQRYHLSIGGGVQDFSYYVSLGISHSAGMFHTDKDYTYSSNSELTNYKFLSNIDFKPWRKTTVGFRIGGEVQDNNYPSRPGNIGEVYSNLFVTPANAFPMYFNAADGYHDQTGNLITGIGGKITAGDGIRTNPWAQLNRNGNTATHTIKGMVQTSVEQQLSFITPGLSARGMVYFTLHGDENLDRRIGFANYQYMSPGSLYMRGTEGSMPNTLQPKSMNRVTSYELALDYQRTCGCYTYYGDLVWNRYEDGNISDVPVRFESVGLVAGYEYDGRYSLDASLAYGGTHKLAKGKKYHFYPSVAGGWNVSAERFFDGLRDAIPHLKLRASYGILSTNDALAFAYMTDLTQQAAQYNTGNNMVDVAGVFMQQVPNSVLEDGEARQMGVGLDVNFIRGCLALSADVYSHERCNLPITPDMSYSQIFGFVNIPAMNVGHERTRGIEVSARYTDSRHTFRYFVGGDFTFQQNEILEWDEPVYPYDWMYHKGHGQDDFFGLVADGIFRSQNEVGRAAVPAFASPQPGDIRYADLNGDGTVDQTNDVRWLGYGPNPRIYYGFQAGAKWKGVDLSVLFQGTAQTSTNLREAWRSPFLNNGSVFRHQLDMWSPENPNASLPRAEVGASSNNSVLSSFWIKDAGYLRLKNLVLGYTLPERISRKVYMRELRVFVSGYNLLTWDKLDVIDPEATGNGVVIAPARAYNIGLSLKF